MNKDEYHRFEKESLILNGIVTLAFGLLPAMVILVIQAVNLSGISISAGEYIIGIFISLLIGGIGNGARMNNKYKKKQGL